MKSSDVDTMTTKAAVPPRRWKRKWKRRDFITWKHFDEPPIVAIVNALIPRWKACRTPHGTTSRCSLCDRRFDAGAELPGAVNGHRLLTLATLLGPWVPYSRAHPPARVQTRPMQPELGAVRICELHRLADLRRVHVRARRRKDLTGLLYRAGVSQLIGTKRCALWIRCCCCRYDPALFTPLRGAQWRNSSIRSSNFPPLDDQDSTTHRGRWIVL